MHKIKQRIISFILMAVMIITMLPSSMVAASEYDDIATSLYKAVISETEHGNAMFSDDGITEIFTIEGGEVDVYLNADSGFEFDSAKISDADTQQVIQQINWSEVQNDKITFVMPATDVVIDTVFDVNETEITVADESSEELDATELVSEDTENDVVDVFETTTSEIEAEPVSDEITEQSDTNVDVDNLDTETAEDNSEASTDDVITIGGRFANMNAIQIEDYLASCTDDEKSEISNTLTDDELQYIREQFGYTEDLSEDEKVAIDDRIASLFAVELDIYSVEYFDAEYINSLDFSSKRLIVGANDSSVFSDDSVIISEYNGVYLLQFEDEDTAKRAYAYYQKNAIFVEVDTGISVAEGDAAEFVSDTTVMTEDSNPFMELEEAVSTTGFGSYDIALIDTGANGANESVSMLGDYAGDDNGHGTTMLGYIREENPNASVLSIKAMGADGHGSVSSVYAAIEYAMSKNVKIINLSISARASLDSELIEDAMNMAAAQGIIVVGSAGNNGNNASYYVPGRVNSAYIVGSCDEDGNRKSFSNYGDTVDYYVVSESTSEAAARMSGLLTIYGLDSILQTNKVKSTSNNNNESQSEDNMISFVGTNEDGTEFTVQAYYVASYGDTLHYMDGVQVFCAERGVHNPNGGGYYRNDAYVNDTAKAMIGYIYNNSSWGTAQCAIWLTLLGGWNGYGFDMSDDGCYYYYYSYTGPNSTNTMSTLGLSTYAATLAVYRAAYQAVVINGETEWINGFGGYYTNGQNMQDVILPLSYIPEKEGNAYFKKEVKVNDGTLRIYKDVVGDDTVKSWTFTVEYGPTTNYGTSKTVKVSSGSYQDVTIPAGYYYKVTENDYLSSGYKTEYLSGNSYKSGRSVTGRMPNDAADKLFTFTFGWNDGKAHAVYYLPNGNDWNSGWISQGSYYSGEKFSLYNGDYLWVEGVKEGYTVNAVEDKLTTSGWSVNPSGRVLSSSITANTNTNLGTFINTYSPGTVEVKFRNTQLTGSIQIDKVLDTSELTDTAIALIKGKSDYSVNGTEYTVYTNEACTTKYGNTVLKITASDSTGMSGSSNVIQGVPFGTYWIKETKAGSGLEVNTEKYKIVIDNNTYSITQKPSTNPVKDYPQLGDADLTKVSGAPNLTDGNACYSLQGAVYEIFSDSSLRTLYATATTDANGHFIVKNMPFGTYYIKEKSASKGYDNDVTIYPVTLSVSNRHGKVTSKEPADADPIAVLVSKTDAESGGNTPQGDGALQGAEFTVKYYANMNWSGEPTRTWVFKTKSDGRIRLTPEWKISGDNMYVTPDGTYAIPTGTFTIEETKSPEGYLRDTTVYKYSVTGNDIDFSGAVGEIHAINTIPSLKTENDAIKPNHVYRGGVQIVKNDADHKASDAQGDADLSGITFTITNKSAEAIVIKEDLVVDGKVNIPKGTYESGQVVGTITTFWSTKANAFIATTDIDEEGVNNVLPYGTYALQETATNDSYLLTDNTVRTIQIREDGKVYTTDTSNKELVATNEVIRGGVKIQKVLDELGVAENEGLSSLENCTFEIVNASEDTVYVNGVWYDAIADKGTNNSNTENSVSKTNVGYTRDQLIDAIEAAEESGKNVVVETLTTDKNGFATTTADTLPYGTYYIYEASANDSVMIDKDWVIRLEVREDGKIIDATTIPVEDPIVRADINFAKVNIDGEFRPNTPFLFMALDANGNAIESHVAVTDGEGNFNSAVRDNTNNTNGFDQYVEFVDGEYIVNEAGEKLLASGEAAQYGIWFSQGLNPETCERTTSKAVPTNDRGALYYGNYRIFEIKCKENTEKAEDLLKTDIIPITASMKTVEKDSVGRVRKETSDHSLNYRHFVDLEVELTTEALDDLTKTHVTFVNDNVVLSDKIHYTHLKTTTEYKWVVNFVETTNPSNVLSSITVDNYKPAASSSYVKTAEGYLTVHTDGTITAADCSGAPVITSTGNVNTEMLNGKDISVIVYLYEYTTGYDFNTGTAETACDFITSHNGDRTDEQEKIYVPSIKTVASDNFTNDHVGTKSTENAIRDDVYMTNLGPKENYILIETVMDKETGEVFAEAQTETKTFYSGRPDGSYRVAYTVSMPEIPIDSSMFEAKTLVVYEQLWRVDENGRFIDPIPVVTHESLLDEQQSVHYIEINTTAVDGYTNDHVGTVTEKTTITDTVELKNLIPGVIYTIRGELVYKEDCVDADGNEHEAGEAINTLEGSDAEVLFTADAKDMNIDIVYVIDSHALEGVSLVSTEYAYHNNVLIDKHVDLEDEDQTVHFPKIRTSLNDSIDDEADALAEENIRLIDKVSYWNLIPGIPYTLNGILMDKDTNQPALDDNGNQITATSTFIPSQEDGVEEITFTFSGVSLAGHAVVAFETLIHNNVEVTVHKDIADEDQTVRIPKIETTLVDSIDSDKDALASEDIILIDTVNYERLLVGREYTVTGVLMDKDTNQPALDDNGEQIIAETSFVPDNENGSVEVTFKFSGVSLAGHSVVAFEDLYRDDKHVAVHADIADDDQTVDIPKIETTLVDTIDSEHDALASGIITLVDTVDYTNLIVGRDYTVKGILMDKDTNKPALDDDGNEITSESKFTATTKDGNVELTFTFSGVTLAGHTTVAFEELYRDDKLVAVHADIEDEEQSVHIPEIKTTLVDTIDSEHDALAAEDITIIDTVVYTNLLVGRAYTISGTLMDKATGEPVLDDNGHQIKASKEFTAETANGSIDITFTFSGVSLAGHTVVAFEELYRDDKLVAVHTDIDDEEQSVHIPKIETTLVDSIDDDKDALASEEIVLIDTVPYENLIVGKEYRLSGILMDKDTNQPAVDDNGEQIKAETKFVAESENGSINLTFTFSGVSLAGHTVVAFENLYTSTKHVAVHADIDDDDQTVYIPKIETTLEDTIDGEHDALASETVVVKDTVKYENLIVGREYVISGILMDKATGKAALDDSGNMIEAETTFVAETTDGAIDVEFTFSGVSLAGHTVVAFETLIRNGKTVAVHCDIDDFDQSVFIPKITTELVDTVDSEHDALASEDIVLVDTVTYENLFVGRNYTMKGILMDKATGEPALDDNGKEITAEAKFVPEEVNGTIELTFKFSGVSLAGHSVVAFENLYRDDKHVAVHADIYDEDQTVHIPEIETTLSDIIDNEHDALASESVTLIDAVLYTNLIVGKEYTMKGVLMDKESGEPALDDDGNQITAEKTFVAETEDGSVDIVFTFSGKVLEGHTVVAFEELYTPTKKVAVHTDINDDDQSVYIPKIRTTLEDTIDNEHDALAAENVILRDTVRYENLIVGREYTISGILMDKQTEEPALDDNGNTIVSQTTFVAEQTDGSIDVVFEFSGVSLAGHTVVAFETLYRDDKVVGVHCNIEDVDQSVFIPKITTSLNDSIDGDKDALASEDIVLIDTVTYTNLLIGRTYTLKGILMDKETNEPALDDSGNEITSEVTFIAETANGTIDMEFKFSGVSLAGHSVVAFEDLYRDDKHVAIHNDIYDDDQTVDIPKIETTLVDSVNGEKDALASENIVLVDTVRYENLIVGRNYTIKGILMDKDTNKPILDDNGAEITSEASFVAEEKDGSIELTFTFSGLSIAGHSVVAFENLYRDEKHVATHEDIEDEDQTVYIPKIETSLKDIIDDEHDAFASTEITLVDEVSYENLLPGKEYTMNGVLMDKSTGEPALDDNGNEITAQAIFTPEEPDGTIELTFTFSGVSLAGHSVVAFERLERLEKEVALHLDIEDDEQTVNIPKIGTTLVEENTKLHSALVNETITVIDTVVYENLIPGKTYIVSGTLMDKETGESLDITAEQEFVAETADGSIELTFVLSDIPEYGLTVVAFEELYTKSVTDAAPDDGQSQDDEQNPDDGQEPSDGEDNVLPDNGIVTKLVAEHKDINDLGQTVSVPQIATTLTDASKLKTVNGYGTITVYDEVKYSNMYPGTYTVKGVLMDKETSEPVQDKDGNQVTSTAKLVVKDGNTSGKITLKFAFEAPHYIGKQIVAFESIYESDVLIAEHADINDENQTVNVLSIRTVAHNDKDGKMFESVLNNTVLDTVIYAGLEPGHEYIMHGALMDKETGKAITINGSELTSDTKFVAEEESGEVVVKIDIPAGTFVGTAVVFEQLLDAKTGQIVCLHEDIEDSDQTVFFTLLKTKAAFKDGTKEATLTTEQIIVDAADYEGLEPGRDYIITGTLINKETGKVVTSLGKPVTTDVEFKAKESNGTVNVELIVPLRTVKGDTVCFEVIKDKETGEVVASHQDINDADQTVTFYNTPTPRTGDTNDMFIWLLISGFAILTMFGCGFVVYKSRKKNNT